jgi:hypothetical protein
MVTDELPGLSPRLAAIRYSPDGHHLISLDQAGRIVLSDPVTHEVIRAFESPSRLNMPEGALAFDASGHYMLAIAGPSITLWDLEAGQQIGTGFPNDRGNVAFIQDGADHPQLVTAEGQSRMIWDLDIDNWVDTACDLAGRNMTVEEWEEFGPKDAPYRATCEQWPTLE